MDWIDTFLDYTAGLPSPKIFRLWSGITAISGALDRRVWADIGLGPCYPNLYTLLVGPPGTGKSQAITPVKKMWMETPDLHTAPDNVTKAALVDALNHNTRFFVDKRAPNGCLEIHSLLVPAPEFGVFISRHDLEFLSVLNTIFDTNDNYREQRRSMEGRNPDIANPQITILAGTQPDFLATMLPEEAWGQGFCSRLILVYAAEPPKIQLFQSVTALKAELLPGLKDGMNAMAQLYGEAKWTKAAKVSLTLWHEHNLAPVPEHSKLTHYVTRRLMQILKLCCISAVSRCGNVHVEEKDVERVKVWLREAELVMPDIFRAMLAHSDSEIINELHQFLWKTYASLPPEKRIPILEDQVYTFLKDRLPSEKIGKIVEVSEKAGIIQRSAGGGWIPRPLLALVGGTAA
jgi:Protein of unknown function (DUF3987)